MKFQKKFFRSEGLQMRYFELGAGHPILFLHGGGVEARTYAWMLELLARRYRVIAPDLPGFGGSTTPKTVWGLHEYATFLARFLVSLHIHDLTVIGHSLGGGIALHLAINVATLGIVTRLVLVDSAGIPGELSAVAFRYKFYFAEPLSTLVQYRNLSRLAYVIKDFLSNRMDKILQWEHIVQIIRKCLTSEFPAFDEVRCPTLILWGKKDQVFPPIHAQYFHQRIRGSDLKFVKGNHDWCLFKPDELYLHVDRWLRVRMVRTAELRVESRRASLSKTIAQPVSKNETN